MKVVGKYRTVYECDQTGKMKDGEGSSYPVKGSSGKRVKLFEKGFCTIEKEQAMNGVLAGETEWYGPQVLDLVYSHGKFAGYVYEETSGIPEPVLPEEPEPADRFQERKKSELINRSGMAVRGLKPLYTLGIGILLPVLTYFFFFDLYIGLVERVGSQDLADYSYTFNFSGITGMIGGIAVMLLAVRFFYQKDDGIYCISLPFAYLAGMAGVFLMVTVIILLLQIAYAVFVALVPVLIVIGAILYLIKSVFKR